MSPPEAASGQTQLLERGWNGISEAGATLARVGLRLADRPLPVLGGLVAVQWLALLAFALTVRHNGLVFYQGGDQINYTTNAWLLGSGSLPPAILGWGWPFVLLPFGWLAESDYVSFLPWTIGLNVLVLGPLALACVYALAARIGGRLLGLWAAALWVAAPYLAIPFFRADYHDRYVEQFLPQRSGSRHLPTFRPWSACSLRPGSPCARSMRATGRMPPSRVSSPASGSRQAGERALPRRACVARPVRAPLPARAAVRRWARAAASRSCFVWKARGTRRSASFFALEQTRHRGRRDARCAARRRAWTSAGTSTSTGRTSAATWPSCASSSGARACSSGCRSQAPSRSRGGRCRWPACSRAGSRPSSSSRERRRSRPSRAAASSAC